MKLILLICLLLATCYCETAKQTSGNVKFLVFTEECYETFFVQNNFTHSECITMTISKLIGLSIVAFATILKVPQIMKILNSKSVDGLVFTGFYTELVMYTLTIGYNMFLKNSFNLYGENVFIAIQNVVILLLFFKFDKQSSKLVMSLMLLVYTIGTVPTLLQLIPGEIYNYSMYINMGLIALARLPQIWQNFKNSSTGQLAFVSVFLSFAGSGARLMTQLKENPDDVLSLLLTLESVALNGILLLQILIYWNSGSKKVDDKKKKQ